MQRKRRRRGNNPPDLIVFLATLGLLSAGIVMVFSASSVTAYMRHGDALFFLKRQLIWTIIGVGAMIAVMRIDYNNWRKWSIPLLLVTIVLLVLVLVPGVSDEISGARRWIRLGPIGIQPSEIAKLGIIVFLSAFLASKRTSQSLVYLVIPILIFSIIAGLIMMEPDLGTTVALAGVLAIMLFAGGINLKYLMVLGAMGISSLLYLALSEDYRRDRLLSFRDPWSDPGDTGWHIIQSLLALGSGGLFGLGLGQSKQKYLWLPERHTDFIYSVIGEELGFIGCFAIIVLFFLFAWRGYRIAITAPDAFGSLMAAGITSMIVLQALINIAVVSGSMPITGISLPFVSYGGSSLGLSLVSVGILLNISTHSKE